MSMWSLLSGMVRPKVSVAAAHRRPTALLQVEHLERRLTPTNIPWAYMANFGTDSIDRYDENSALPWPAPAQVGSTFVPSGQDGMHHPLGVIVGYDHLLYVSNLETNEILRYDATTGAEMPADGESGATFVDASAGLHNPAGILFGPDGLLYVSNADPATSNVMRFDPNTGAFIDVYAQLDTMGGATGMVFGPDGKLYIGTRFSNGVVRTDGTTIEDFVMPDDHGLNRTGGFVFGPDRNFYVASESTNNILRFDGITGAFIDEFVPSGSGGLSRPAGILFGPDGNLYVSSIGTNSILRYDGHTGEFIDAFITPDNGGTVNGPREFSFWNTNPTTLKYEPGRTGDGRSPNATADRVLVAGLNAGETTPATTLIDLNGTIQSGTWRTTGSLSSDTSLASAPTISATSSSVGRVAAGTDGLASTWLDNTSDLDLQAWIPAA
jgi:streptogramin lyase